MAGDPNNIFSAQRNDLMQFVARSEPWCEYELEDGTIVRVRIMLTKVSGPLGIDGNGNPLYNLAMQQVCDVTPSELAIRTAKERGNK